jgi:hypothetical protein
MDESGISNRDFLKWILCGELLHVGRHTAWGDGMYMVTRAMSEKKVKQLGEVLDVGGSE